MCESSGNDLQSLLHDIKASDVVESRIKLLSKLRETDLYDKSDFDTLIDFLSTLWEDFTCLDLSQCMLNKAILHVAAKYVETDISLSLGQFLSLCTQGSIWCRKHLTMTLMASEDSQEEEHSGLFFQLLLDLLNFSAASFSAVAKNPVSCDKELVVITERFVLEQLNLAKELISENKKIIAFGPDILKATQVVLDAAIKLCRAYSQSVNWELSNKFETDSVEFHSMNHVLNIKKCVIEKLSEVGIVAANDGGGLVTILNMSWKGVVTLLQLGKGALVPRVNIPDIILTLQSLAIEPLRCVSMSWLTSSLKELVSVTEAKRTFLPVKFYLINAVRISSQYPCQACLMYKELTLGVLKIATFIISLSKEPLLKIASEVSAELLIPTAFHLLNSLLSSPQLKQELKDQLLDWLFIDKTGSSFAGNSIDEIFSVNTDTATQARMLLIGRVFLFLNFLQYSVDVDEDMRLGMSKKLGWLFDAIIDEEIYASLIVLQIPILYSTKNAPELGCYSMFSYLLHSLKTFMIVISSSAIWKDFMSFLLENFFHPHFLCWEVIMELWCFILRHGEIDMVNEILDKLCSVLKFLASRDSAFVASSALRKMARSICWILTFGTQSMVDRVYSSILGGKESDLSSVMYVALLIEGFPLNFLADSLKSIVTDKIATDYFRFMENLNDYSLSSSNSGLFGVPVFALSAALQSLHGSISVKDSRTLKFLLSVIHEYKNSSDDSVKDNCRKLLTELLIIISNMEHLYAQDEMGKVILELQNLFISSPSASDTLLHKCKSGLANFMAGLGYMEISENNESTKSIAVWELYHMLLRERHWAFIHLATTAFGYFAARTSCNQLWRFLPPDAALSFDIETGTDTNEDRFMSELKAFLDKEMGTCGISNSLNQLAVIVKEGLLLKEKLMKYSKVAPEVKGCEFMEIHAETHANKRRKLPKEITEGMELLQCGLKVMGDGISRMQGNNFEFTELPEKFLNHFSRLEDAISHLVGLTGSG